MAERGSEGRTFAAALAFAQDLIRIPSPPGAEGDVAQRVVAELEKLRFDDVFTDDVGNVIGIIRGTVQGAPSVMLSSHMDVSMQATSRRGNIPRSTQLSPTAICTAVVQWTSRGRWRSKPTPPRSS